MVCAGNTAPKASTDLETFASDENDLWSAGLSHLFSVLSRFESQLSSPAAILFRLPTALCRPLWPFPAICTIPSVVTWHRSVHRVEERKNVHTYRLPRRRRADRNGSTVPGCGVWDPVTLTVNVGPSLQQILNRPCVIGDPSCHNKDVLSHTLIGPDELRHAGVTDLYGSAASRPGRR